VRRLRTFAAALAGATALGCSPVFADPISIGFFLFSGPLGAFLSFQTLVAASQIGLYALVGGAVAVGSALVGRQRQKVDPGQFRNTFKTADSSEVNAIGRVKLSGLLAFGNTAAFDRYRLILHAASRLIGIEQHYLGGREVTVEPDGNVSSPPWGTPSGSYCYVTSKIGDGSESAWSALVSAFPSLWSSAHRVRGIAQSLVKFISPGYQNDKFARLYAGGEPEYSIVARFNTVYDPREVGQNPADPGTWGWSDNGVLCAARILMAYPDVAHTMFDWTDIATQANAADATVATKTGTEKRSRCWGVWLSEANRGDTMAQVLDSVGAEIVMSEAGLIRIRLVGDTPTSEIAITPEMQTAYSWQSGPEAVERPNLCVVKYYSPELGYAMGEIDMTGIAWARIDDEVTRYGEKPFTVELPFCPSPSQAQRIARRLFALARADTGQVVTDFSGLAAWGCRYGTITDPVNGQAQLAQLGTARIDDAAGQVSLPFVIWPALTAWNPAADEADAPEEIPPFEYESTLEKPAAPAEYAQVRYHGGGAYEIRMRFTGVSGGTTAEAVFQQVIGGVGQPNQSMQEYVGTGGAWHAWDTDDRTGQHVRFKARWFNADEEGSAFSDPLDANPVAVDNTAPAAPTLTVTPSFNSSTNIWTFAVSAKTAQLRVVKIVLQQLIVSTWTDIETGNVRPEQTVAKSIDIAKPATGSETIKFRAYAYTTDGTASPPTAEFSQVISA